MGSSGGYRGLEVYQDAHRLGVQIHRFSLRLPKYEQYETAGQLRRSSKSVSANIVEGYGRRRYKADFIRFLVYALASCDETNEWLTYCRDCHEGIADQADELLAKATELGKKLNRFLQGVETGHRS
jgi:four helix bundle protein